MPTKYDLRETIRHYGNRDERKCVKALIQAADPKRDTREKIQQEAIHMVEACRAMSEQAGTLDAFLQEFGLSNKEGVALMCLAESLLRVPDEYTANQLIAEKIASGDWRDHQGKSSSTFVNASVWGLMLTGKVVQLDKRITTSPQSWLKGVVSTLGEPVVRGAILQAMRIMGGQYVLGRTISEAIKNGRAQNSADTRFSFDMLGEGARTGTDAENYFAAYAEAIETIGKADSPDVTKANGISVKLSALHPRFEALQTTRVRTELLPRVRELARMARARGIGFTLDAEESERLEPTLDIFEALVADKELNDWEGLGFVLQAYQKRAPHVARWLIAIAKHYNQRLMVRLVKGAYWDSEIKRTQELGLKDYPVFTRKCHSDLSYEVCAKILLNEQECIYPQFATHNAHTIATILSAVSGDQTFEFQRLHGMGHLLYQHLRDRGLSHPVRVYAPVGKHADLLPYLVRRLLENGANSSFVNRFLDANTPARSLMADPLKQTTEHPLGRHTAIPKPRYLYQKAQLPWQNSNGLDLFNPCDARLIDNYINDSAGTTYTAAPIINGELRPGKTAQLTNPANLSQVIGTVTNSTTRDAKHALEVAYGYFPDWSKTSTEQRVRCLERMAEALETHFNQLLTLIVREAGRAIDDAISEIREAVDFCRYYARHAARLMTKPEELPGPAGEVNCLNLEGRGVFLCISPWNFPLAIFTGQIAAALVTGNTVIAKPAEQTPLTATFAVKLFLEAGIPKGALQLLPGDGPRLCAPLLKDARLAGVTFTGGTEAAQAIQRNLAERRGPIIPFIAETGGLNTMIVDSTALPEQVVDDIVASAFKSAGQRCSALRVVYLQEDIADEVITKLKGAMQELTIGNPEDLSTDIGPLIDSAAVQNILSHKQQMQRRCRSLATAQLDANLDGHYVAPEVFAIQQLSDLETEVFGPVLHVLRFKAQEVDQVIADINASRYGLTLGIHSRIDGFAQHIFQHCRVGNTYVNRNMVGAVVGVNPFGGQGLSGTGPKAGGPNYLMSFVTEKTFTENLVAKGGNAQLLNLADG